MTQSYTPLQIRLHWLIVALVALQYILHDPISDAFEMVEDGASPGFSPLVAAHVFGGFLIFAATLIRFSVRLSHGAPHPPVAEPDPFRTIAHLAHWAFYGLLVLLPVSGAVAWFRASEIAADVHEVLRALLLALIVLHVAGVLVHQFVWKTAILDRMRLRKS